MERHHRLTEEQSLKLADLIGEWIEKKLSEAQIKEAVLGFSGGADSMLVGAILARRNLKFRLVALPCAEDPETTTSLCDARRGAAWLNHPLEVANIWPAFQGFKSVLPPAENWLADANLKSRLRMCALYYFANNVKGGALVVGTTNQSELFIGYMTKYGDGGVDIEPIACLRKSDEVYDLLEALDAPEWIMTKAPTADLAEGQTDEGEIGFSYATIDDIIEGIETKNPKDLNSAAYFRVVRMNLASEHKRVVPPAFEKPEGF
jgi:NAD+ synthase